MQQGAGNLHPAAMAAIQRPHRLARAFGHAEALQRCRHAGLRRAPGKYMQRGGAELGTAVSTV